jgi:hypothetical protein
MSKPECQNNAKEAIETFELLYSINLSIVAFGIFKNMMLMPRLSVVPG